MAALVVRRSTVLADARRRGASTSSAEPAESTGEEALVRVGGPAGGADGYEWAGMENLSLRGARAARTTPRPSSSTRPVRTVSSGLPEVPRRTRVGTVVLEQPWLVVSTTWSRRDLETKQAIPVGSVVRFTAQRGLRAADDSSEMAILRGRVVAGRSTLLPDSYAVQVLGVVDVHELDPSAATPAAGTVFLVAPESVGSIESTGTEAPPPLAIPSPSEVAGSLPQPTDSTPPPGWTPASVLGALGSLLPGQAGAQGPAPTAAPAPVVTPSTAAGTTDSVATRPAGLTGTAVAIALGAVAVLAAGFVYWRYA